MRFECAVGLALFAVACASNGATAGGSSGGATTAGSATTTGATSGSGASSGSSTGSGSSSGTTGGIPTTCQTIVSGAVALSAAVACTVLLNTASNGAAALTLTEASGQPTVSFNITVPPPLKAESYSTSQGDTGSAETLIQDALDAGVNAWTQIFHEQPALDQGTFTLAISSASADAPHGTLDATLLGLSGNSVDGGLTIHVEF